MNEISLQDLIRLLWRHRAILLGCTILSLAIAAGYAFWASPVYESSAEIFPPTRSELLPYSSALSRVTDESGDPSHAVPDSVVYDQQTQDVYATFIRHLASSSLKRTFFKDHYLPAVLQGDSGNKARLRQQLDDDLSLDFPKRKDDYTVTVKLRGKDPAQVAQLTNAYVELALAEAKAEYSKDLQAHVQASRAALDNQVQALKGSSKESRQFQLERLRSALKIAESLGLKDSAYPSMPVVTQGDQPSDPAGLNSLLYLHGTKALEAEIKMVESRENDDAYIAQLPALQEKLRLLDTVDTSLADFAVAHIDQPAVAAYRPVAPQKDVVLVLGLILGLVIGMLVIVVRRSFE